ANYYFYDSLSPLKRLLEENFNISSTDYGFLIAAYSLPNTFLLMAIFGGVILDRIGIRKTGFLFVGMMAIGGVITAYGASEYYSNGGFGYSFFNSFLTGYSPELKIMFLGRFLFGLGAETSIVVVSKIIVKWFKGKELAFAFGMKIGIARAGSALALFYSAEIAEAATHWTIAIWFAAMLLLIAFLAFLVYTIFDVRLDKQIKQVNLTGNDDKFRFADIGTLFKNKSFIYVTLLCLTFYSAVFPFQAFSPDFMLNKFGMSLTQSGKIASILYWVTMFATPLFGLFIDKIGKSASIMIFGSVLLTMIHLTLAFTNLNPVVPLVLLGISIALVPAAMWPSVAKIVPEKRIGSAYGAMFSIQNL
ncbi:MAG: MFS transporter, partial [Bacteroidales bacterium]|nr:MFS transporter [Bacteroidales bacterium]